MAAAPVLTLAVAVLASFAAVFFILHPYVLSRRESALAAGVAALLVGVALLIPWPERPLYRVLSERGLSSAKSFQWTMVEFRSRRQAKSFDRALKSRFKGAVSFAADPGQPDDAPWVSGRVGTAPGWLERKTGLVWGPALALKLPDYSTPSWQSAEAACREREPRGFWSLPVMAEFIKGRNDGLMQALPDIRASGRWYADVFVPDLRLSTMGLFSVGPSHNAGPSHLSFGVRCVARTEAAPAEGYLALSNEEALEAMSGGKK